MSNSSGVHHRRSIRLPGYDYAAAGAYFITICTQGRECLFGQVADGEMRLNDLGEIVREEWEKSARMRVEIELGEFVVMPNHFHAIVVIRWGDGRGDRPVARTEEKPVARTKNRPDGQKRPNGPDSRSIGALMAGFKSAVTGRINQIRKTPGTPVWQRNYYEHIIRDEQSCENIAAYILNNPRQWEADQLFRTG